MCYQTLRAGLPNRGIRVLLKANCAGS
jgi:hypothetical protein